MENGHLMKKGCILTSSVQSSWHYPPPKAPGTACGGNAASGYIDPVRPHRLSIKASIAFVLLSQSDSRVNDDVRTGDESCALCEPNNGLCNVVRRCHLI